MKNRYSALLFAALIFFACKTTQTTVQNEDLNPKEDLANSLLWKIDKEGFKSSYVFGTIHIIPSEDYFFPANYAEAFKSVDQVAFEFDLEEAMDFNSQMSLMQKAMMNEDVTLKDLISDEDYVIVNDFFKELGIPLFLLERMKPMFLSVFAESQSMFSDSSDMRSYEMELMELAKNESKEIVGLETMDYQLSIFDSIPYEDQAKMLVESIKTESSGAESEIDTLIYYYKKQDLNQLSKLIHANEDYVEYQDLLLNNRNRNWIPVMESLMLENTMFFAVGAGHLVGEEGVLTLLKDRGFSVIAVRRLDGTN